MAFNPSSTIYLCNVPIDNTYTNQIYFSSAPLQHEYFLSKVQKTFSNYLTVRRTLPDGSTQSSVKVNASIDELQHCNYMCYQNSIHGTKWFYAFIVKLIYINEGTTEIRFETDAWQTWCFDVDIMDSYVVREHSVTDGRGENVVPEKFSFQDFIYTKYPDGITSLGEWGYLITSTEPYNDDATEELPTGSSIVRLYSGIFQGLYFYFFTEYSSINTFLSNIDKDCIISITVIPSFNLGGYKDLFEDPNEVKEGWVERSNHPASKAYSFNLDAINEIDGYQPVNNKLFTAPFFKLWVTNNSGDEAEYIIEDFADPSHIAFKLYGDISVNPSLTLIPVNYKNVAEHYTAGISIKSFPQCSFNTDTFKLWLAKNQFSLGVSTVYGVGSLVGGMATAMTGVGTVAGVSAIANGASSILGTIGNVYAASHEPNRGHTGNTQNNLLTAMGRNKFDFYIQQIKREHAETVDQYFTMFGYQTNKLKKPNLSSRPYFNYVQTIDINIVGGIPNDDMRTLKDMFNNGVTFWKPNATVGDYSVDNRPSE